MPDFPWTIPGTTPDMGYDEALYRAFDHLFGPGQHLPMPLAEWVAWAGENRRRVWRESNRTPADPTLNDDLLAYWAEPFDPQPTVPSARPVTRLRGRGLPRLHPRKAA